MKLQFGHGTDAVDDLQGRRLLRRLQWLQFGHGTDAVDDNVLPLPIRHCSVSFNSATALMPWMTWIAMSILLAFDSCFNSATALMPWMTQTNNKKCH